MGARAERESEPRLEGTAAISPSVVRNRRGILIDVSPLQTLLARLEEAFRPEQVWLFGSRARGDAQAGSDWDLLVVVPDDTNEEDLSPSVSWRLQRNSGVYADVILYRSSEFMDDLGAVNTVLYDVKREGVLIYAH
jgi:predicted nucleotidyltransferase